MYNVYAIKKKSNLYIQTFIIYLSVLILKLP